MKNIKFRAYIRSLKWIVPVERINFDIGTIEVDLTDGNGDTAEYGFDEIELHLDAFNDQKGANVLLIDDIIVTGGTAYAAANLIKKLNVNLVESCFLMNIAFLNGAQRLEKVAPVYAVLEI